MKLLKKSLLAVIITVLLFGLVSPITIQAKSDTIKICIGWTEQLSVDTKKSVTWISSDTSVATVSKKGLVTGKGIGSVIIVAQYGDSTSSWLVKVFPAEEEVVVYEHDVSKPKGLPSKKSLLVGQTYTLKLNGIEGKAKWSTSKKSIVTVSSKGEIKGIEEGSATITAAVGNKKYTCKVTVKSKTLSTNKRKITTSVGKKVKVVITLKTDLEDAVYAKITNNTTNGRGDALRYYGEEEIATYKFGKWDGDDIPIYITATAVGETHLIITSENTKEKIIIPLIIK